MSNTEQQAKDAEQPAPKSDSSKTSKSPKAQPKPSRVPTLLATLALLVALAALGLSAYLGWRGQPLEENQPALISGQEQLQAQIARQQARLTESIQTTAPLHDQITAQEERGERLLSRVDSLSRNLKELAGTSRSGWKLAEVEYLLRLANQRLLMTADVRGAKALLKNADSILVELDDYTLYPVREALAEDLTLLKAIPDFDQEGLYLRIDALSEQVYELPLLQKDQLKKHSEELTTPEETTTAPGDWKAVVLGMLKSTWDNFTGLFRFTPDRGQAVAALLSPEEDVLIRQNLLLMLEQSQLALLSRDQVVYNRSLIRAKEWIEQYFSLSGGVSQSLISELEELAQLTVSPKLPNISHALEALKSHQSSAAETPEEKPASKTNTESSDSEQGTTPAQESPEAEETEQKTEQPAQEVKQAPAEEQPAAEEDQQA